MFQALIPLAIRPLSSYDAKAMREFEVLFSAKAPSPAGQPEKIVTEIGARHWRMEAKNAIGWLRADAQTFYVKVGEQKVHLVVAMHEGSPFLRTSMDWAQPNELLNLPDLASK